MVLVHGLKSGLFGYGVLLFFLSLFDVFFSSSSDANADTTIRRLICRVCVEATKKFRG